MGWLSIGCVVVLVAWLAFDAPRRANRPAVESGQASDVLAATPKTVPSTVNGQVDPSREPMSVERILEHADVARFVVEVMQADQSPLSEGDVAVVRDRKVLRHGKTDDSGQASFEPIDGPVEVIVFTGLVQRSRTTCASGSGLERIALDDAASLAGMVLVDGQVPGEPIWLWLQGDGDRGDRGKPPAWLWQQLGLHGYDGLPYLTVRTDAGGAFRCDGLLPGWSGTIDPAAWQGYQAADESTPFHLIGPKTRVVVPLVAQPTIRGRIVRPDNRLPVPGVEGICEMFCQASSEMIGVRCGSDGRFEIPISGCSSLESASLEFSAPGLGFAASTVEGLAAPSGIDLGDIVLEPVRDVHFVVHTAEGRPLPGAVARVSGSKRLRSTPTDQEGTGVLLDLPSSAGEFLVDAFNHQPAVVPVSSTAGTAVAPIEVVLSPLRALLISVEHEFGGTLPDLRVVLVCWSDPAPFDSVDGRRPDPIQIELGASSPIRTRWTPEPSSSTPALELTYRPDAGGRVRIPGLRTSSRMTVSIQTTAEEILASQDVVATELPGMQKLEFELPQ